MQVFRLEEAYYHENMFVLPLSLYLQPDFYTEKDLVKNSFFLKMWFSNNRD